MKEPERAWLIDASIYIFRAWFSLPDRWHSPDGRPLSAVYGYTRFLLDFLLETRGSAYCAVAFDESLGSNFRNEIYPDYKCRRVLPDEDLAFQLTACREMTEQLELPCYGGTRFEADDYIASLARRFRRRALIVVVVSGDKDLGQLLAHDADLWWDHARGEQLDKASFVKRFAVEPQQFADYLALVGDPVDDIPGIPGIGAKTAAALLREFGDIKTLGHNLDRLEDIPLRGASRIRQALDSHWEQLLMARRLTALAFDAAPLQPTPRYRLKTTTIDDLSNYLESLGLHRQFKTRLAALRQIAL